MYYIYERVVVCVEFVMLVDDLNPNELTIREKKFVKSVRRVELYHPYKIGWKQAELMPIKWQMAYSVNFNSW